MSFHIPNKCRVRTGPLASDDDNGNNGAFILLGSLAKKQPALLVIASDGEGWEHVSVSTGGRCPTWNEMCQVKQLFWDDEDRVMQLHPPRSEWINNHPFCLHLWRPVAQKIPRPPGILVGIR